MSPASETQAGSRWALAALAALVVAALAVRALLGAPARFSMPPIWRLKDPSVLVDWMKTVAVGWTWTALSFLPVGLLIALSLGKKRRWIGRLAMQWLPAIGVTLGTAALVDLLQGIPLSGFRHAARLGPPLAGGLLGAWIGVTSSRGRTARLWLVPKLALFASTVVLAGWGGYRLVTDESPLVMAAPPPDTNARARLRDLFARGREAMGPTHTLRLDASELGQLLALATSLPESDWRAGATLRPGGGTLSLSARLPSGRYLNVTVSGRVAVRDGQLDASLDELRAGSVHVPAVLLDRVVPRLIRRATAEPQVGRVLSSIRELHVESTHLMVSYGSLHLEDLLAELLEGRGADDALQAQVRLLAANLGTLPPGDERFLGALQKAFGLARDRSANGGDPVAENRSAVVAIGVVLGHQRLQTVLGQLIDELQAEAVTAARAHTSVRGRADWSRHFAVSAALAVLGTVSASDAGGLLKEEMDSAGGSGFSFGDLLADRAGTTFAEVATRDAQSARHIQELVAAGASIDALVPEGADLPEGLTDAELRNRYGGVGGTGYRRLAETIERRIAGCAAYRD